MSDIRVERRHALGRQAALAAALRVAARMQEKAQVEYKVRGDTIEFERSGAKGKLVVGEDTVTAELKLGLLMKPMKGFIESKLDEYFARYFEAPEGPV